MITIDNKRITEEMKFWQVPALALSVVKDGEIPYHEGFGLSDVKEEKNCNEKTNFLIASCSKAMTSAIIGILVDKGLLDYDTKISEYIDDFHLYDPEADENLTLRDILCHRSGLGGHDAIWPNDKSISEFIQDLRFLKPSAPFREKAQYSNIMYSVLGAVAEKVTGKKWPEILNEYLFEPLHMDTAYSSYEDTLKDEKLAKPYQFIDGKLTELTYWNLDSVSPAASVSCNTEDMCKWLDFLIHRGEPLMTPDTFKGMYEKQIDFEDALGSDSSLFPTDGYAMGWQPGNYKGHILVKHMGKIEGFSSMQIFLPEDNIGIALMMNLHSPSVSILHILAYEILDQLLGLEAEDWISKFRKDTVIDENTYKDCDWDLYSELYPNAHKGILQNCTGLTGEYENRGYGKIKITEENESLVMEYNHRKHILSPYISNPYRIDNFKEDIINFSLPLSFLENRSGEITALKIRFEPLTDDIIFHKL